MEALDKLIENARQTLAHTSRTLEILNSLERNERPKVPIDKVDPKMPEIETNLRVSEPTPPRQKIIKEVFGDEKVRIYKKSSKKWARNYNVDYSDLMNQIRAEKIPLHHFTPRTTDFGAPPAKRLRGDQAKRPIQNPNYKNNQDVLFCDLKRRLLLEKQMMTVNSIRILQLNVCTLTHKKLPYLKELLLSHQPEILLVNEFGVDKDCPVFPQIESYHVVSYELKSTFSGVAIYVQASAIESVQLISTNHSMKMAQICGIQIKNLKIYNVYRSPNMKSEEELQFCQWISELEDANVLIIGDLNLHVSWEDYSSDKVGHRTIANSFLEQGFCQYQFGVTYPSSGRTLDVTLCNNIETVMSCTTDPFFGGPHIAIDHTPTITDVVLEIDLVEEKEIKLWKKRDKEKYVQEVQKEILSLMEYFGAKEEDELDLDEMDSRLTEILLNVEDATVPKKILKPKKMSTGKMDSMSEKTKKLYDIARSHRKAGRVREANKMLAMVKNSLEQDRKNWCMFMVNKLNKDRNALWKMIKDASVSSNSSGPLKRPNGTLTFDSKEKVQLLKNQYQSVLTPKTHPTCNIEDLSDDLKRQGFGEIVISPGDVYRALKYSNNSAAKDSRGLSMPLFREASQVLAPFLAKMFNLSTNESKLALAWLLAMTIPIPKGGDLTLPKQWRPVVLEATTLRIYEAVYNFKFVNYLESINFFHRRQDGFRRGHSTVHNLLEFWQWLVGLMKKYGIVDVIYADTSAAFDRLSHGILLDKLFYECGVHGKAWNILKAWTSKRKQFVSWNNKSSDEFEVTSSCMQGSSLGTTLWNCYFNEVCESLDKWNEELDIEGFAFFVYADDVKIIYVPTPENVWKINILLRRLQAKMESLHLKFNALKCHVLTLGSIRNLRYDVVMKNEQGKEEVLIRTTVERDLGVQIDSDGSFETQIKKCIGTAKATAKIMSRIFKKADFITKVQLYESHVFSRMSYASELWAPKDKKVLEEMNKIYINFFKFVYVPKDRYPPLLPEQALKQKDLTMMFKIFNDISPLDKSNYFDEAVDEPRTRSQAEQKLMTDKWNRWQSTTLVSRNKETWNSIPLHIRSCGSLEVFQDHIRTNILEKMPCNQVRLDLMSGDLRRRSKENEKKTKDALFYANLNKQLGNPSKIKPDDFLLHEDFRDDFLKPDLCFKMMSRKSKNKMEKLKKIAPWMSLCLCDRKMCVDEVERFERDNRKPLRDFPRVILKDNHVITQMNNKQLPKLPRLLDDDNDENDVLSNMFDYFD